MKKRVLLIEDNEQNRYMMSFLLTRKGYEVVEAGDGPAGIELARRIRPALILLDIQLPGMDGYTVAGELKAIPETASIPIVAITSYAMTGDRERGIAAGCDGYMEKPIDPETFAAEIGRYLPGAGGDQGA